MKMSKSGSMVGRINTAKMTTNDGARVPKSKEAAKQEGILDRNTKLSNTDAFEQYRKGGAAINGAIEGMESIQKGVNLDDPGFDASGDCFVKKGTPYGEAAMFNQLPPGPDINDQAYADINDMPLRTYQGGVTFPGDTPWPVRDIEE